MQTYTYQLLMERGWRRCGNYYYKPDLNKSCCKSFTHRLQVDRYRPKKDQKKALKKVITLAYQPVTEKQLVSANPPSRKQQKPKQVKPANKPQELSEYLKGQLGKVCFKLTEILRERIVVALAESPLSEEERLGLDWQMEGKLRFFKSKSGQKANYYCNFGMLLFGLNKKLMSQHKYSLHQFCKHFGPTITGLPNIDGYKLQLQRGGYLLFRLQNAKTNQFQVLGEDSKTPTKEEMLDEKDQMREEKEENKVEQKEGGIMGFIKQVKNKLRGPHQIEERGEQMNEPMLEEKKSSFEVLKEEIKYKGQLHITSKLLTFGRLRIEIVPAEESDESFRMYQRYGKDIHEKKQKKMSQYVRFLCLRALEEKAQRAEGKGVKYVPAWDPTEKHQKGVEVTGEVVKMLGCYHWKYYLGGQLIGIGVVDMLPHGLSSVYFFYEPNYKEYRLGVFSSLIEIEYVRWMQLTFPEFRNYYMGFYIPSSHKMSYKADYGPCQLLCPTTYRFVDLDPQTKAKVQLITKGQIKDLCLAEGAQVIEDMQFGKNIGPYIDQHIKLLYKGKSLVLKQINPVFYLQILQLIKDNLQVWGKTLFHIFTLTL